jgi:type VI secretion system protein ImpJ
MSRYRKILWDEGMLLTPHHFQQWDNYHEESLNFRLSSLIAYEWGILDLQVNSDALSNGFFEILSCRAVMPDGLIVNIPQTDPSPAARSIEGHFTQEDELLEVHLAVPARRMGAANYQTNGAAGHVVRYVQDAGLVPDEVTGENERQIGFARGNLRLMFGDELREGYSAIKIAELERTATGQIALSENWIAPSLNIRSSLWLVNMLRQLIEILITKSSTLAEQRRQRATSPGDLAASEVAVFWLLHTVNAAIPSLMHFFRTRLVHPEKLYERMARLEGELMTFVADRHPKDIVRYEHTDLYFTFNQLSAEIRELLEIVIPTRCVAIPLENVRKSLYVGRVHDDQLLREAAFYIGVRAQMAESRLIDTVPRVIKIAARDVIDAVVGSALPGVTLRHASPPPAPIPARVGSHYFGLDSAGPYWDTIRGSKTIAVYVPDEFPDVKLEMYAVKP